MGFLPRLRRSGALTRRVCVPLLALRYRMTKSGRQLFLFVVFEISRMSPTGGRVLCGGRKNTEYVCTAAVHLVLFTEETKHVSSFVSSSSEVLHQLLVSTSVSSQRHVAQMCHIPN